MKIGDSWKTQISNAISRCAEQGFYVLLISENSLKSQFIKKELEYATAQGAWIVPIVIGNPILPKWLDNWLGQYFRVSEQPSEREFEKVVAMIDSVMLKKIHNISHEGVFPLLFGKISIGMIMGFYYTSDDVIYFADFRRNGNECF